MNGGEASFIGRKAVGFSKGSVTFTASLTYSRNHEQM